MPYGPRYAIYFAPDAASALWRFGSACLSYDADIGLSCDSIVPEGWSESDWHLRTDEPRRYGFHATLKAPFYLKEGISELALNEAFDAFCSRQAPFVIEGLRVNTLSRFIALVPVADSGRVANLASDCVRAFESFRAPLSSEDLERRLLASLTDRQKEYLTTWGYPYVFDEFRFHMTLSGKLEESECAKVEADLSRRFQMMVGSGPVAIDAISLFRQDRRDGRFRIVRRAPLLGPRNLV